MEEGFTGPGVGILDDTEQFFKDGTMPDGDACRPDGTLKDASEMEWLNSLSEETRNLPEVPELTQLGEDGYSLKRSLPCNEEESNSESDGPIKIKVSYSSIVFTDLETYRGYGIQRKTNRVLDSDDEAEGVGRQSKRKVSAPITQQIIEYLLKLPLFNQNRTSKGKGHVLAGKVRSQRPGKGKEPADSDKRRARIYDSTEAEDKGSESDDGDGESVGEETEKWGVCLFSSSLVTLHC